ncbi:MAG: MFS transporter [Chloroflexi bacterium]|nr:MFS transporter [Chloroflexota bacterium]
MTDALRPLEDDQPLSVPQDPPPGPRIEDQRPDSAVGESAHLLEEERPRPEKLWQNYEFLRLWLGQTVSSVGSGITKIAAPLLVLGLTESPALAGLVGASLTFPMVILGLPAGALIDRLDRRKLMIVCDTARALAVVSVPLAWLFWHLSVWHVLVVGLVLGSAQSFFTISQVAALPRLVKRRQIASAHAMNTTSEGVALLASPGLGGMIVGAGATVVAGGVLAYGVDALSYTVSVLALVGIKTAFQARRTPGAGPPLTRQIVEGVHYVWREYAIRVLMILNMGQRFAFSPVMLTVIVLSRDELGLGPAAIGLLFSTAGAGGLSAAAITPWLRRWAPVGWHMVGILVVHAVAVAIVALSGSVWLVAVGLFFEGMMETMTGITQVSFRLGLIPDGLQGRVNSVYRLLSFGATSLGMAGGGFLIDLYGPRPVLWLVAGVLGAIALGSAATGVRTLRD